MVLQLIGDAYARDEDPGRIGAAEIFGGIIHVLLQSNDVKEAGIDAQFRYRQEGNASRKGQVVEAWGFR